MNFRNSDMRVKVDIVMLRILRECFIRGMSIDMTGECF